MKKIIYIAKPFLAEQTLLVYEDGNKIDAIKTTMPNLYESIMNLAQKHEIKQIDLAGPKSYTKEFAEKIKSLSKNTAKFNLKELEINII